MRKYVNRLVKCGYGENEATQICIDFVKNLSIVDLSFFVYSIEKAKYVDKV